MLVGGAFNNEVFDLDRSVTSGAHFLLRSVHEIDVCDVCMANSNSCDCCLVFPYFEIWCFFIREFSDIVKFRSGFSRPYFVRFILKGFEYSFFVFVFRDLNFVSWFRGEQHFLLLCWVFHFRIFLGEKVSI